MGFIINKYIKGYDRMIKIEMMAERKQYVDKTTNDVKNFYVYYVEVNGIKVYLKPTENTGRQLLDMYINIINKGGDDK